MRNLERVRRRRLFAVQIAVQLCFCAAELGQSTACSGGSGRSADPAELAFAQGKNSEAEGLFQQELLHQPRDPRLIAGMARMQLRLGKLDEAANAVQAALQNSPRSAPLEAALADVQLRQGQPWLARESLDRAAGIDPCFAQAWLLRSKVDRLDSMHAAERADIARAYAIDPADAEIKRAWNRIVTPANDLVSTEEYLRTAGNVDPQLRKTVEDNVKTTLQLLSESTQTCKGLPEESTATLPLVPSLQDSRHIDGYQLKVGFGTTGATLRLDTAASGFYISRSLANANGLAHRADDPADTVHADTVHIGPLTFHDCVVGVSDTPFPGKSPGFVGTDLLAQYLTILNFPEAKLLLRPLPKVDGVLPGDRPQSPELSGYSPVYHRLHYLMVPVTLNGKERRLFVLDSGIRLSAMTLPVAHLVSSTKHGFTNSIKTVSGATIQTYNDNFDMAFAHQQLRGRAGILELDSASIENAAGMKIGGLIGLDILQSAVVYMDYRDGLVQMEFPAGDSTAPNRGTLLATSGEGKAVTECARRLPQEVPKGATIVATNTGMLDVHQLKAGQSISLKVERPWETENCFLDRAALVYGHVVRVDKGQDPEPAHLEVVFDRAECFGKAKQNRSLRLVSLVVAADPYSNIDQSLPAAELGGRGRQIQDAVDTTQNSDYLDANPDSKGHTIKTGSVLGLPAVSLETAGPACSAVLTGAGGGLRLASGTHWLLVSEQ